MDVVLPLKNRYNGVVQMTKDYKNIHGVTNHNSIQGSQ